MINVSKQIKLNILAGVGFSVLGLACYGAGAYMAFTVPEPVESAKLVAPDLSDCFRTLSEIGFVHEKLATEIRVSKPSLDNPERLLADASLGISACKLPMLRFCMGPGCSAVPNGISFSLATQFESSAGI